MAVKVNFLQLYIIYLEKIFLVTLEVFSNLRNNIKNTTTRVPKTLVVAICYTPGKEDSMVYSNLGLVTQSYSDHFDQRLDECKDKIKLSRSFNSGKVEQDLELISKNVAILKARGDMKTLERYKAQNVPYLDKLYYQLKRLVA